MPPTPGLDVPLFSEALLTAASEEPLIADAEEELFRITREISIDQEPCTFRPEELFATNQPQNSPHTMEQEKLKEESLPVVAVQKEIPDIAHEREVYTTFNEQEEEAVKSNDYLIVLPFRVSLMHAK